MACTCAPSLVRLTAEVDKLWPNRDRASDGCCASSAHTVQNPDSDHEPNADGYARAKDIDEDLTPNGPGPDNLDLVLLHLYGANEATADKRVKYMIYQANDGSGITWIYYPTSGKRARGRYRYLGPNPHDKHLHVSIFDWAIHDTGTWLAARPLPPPPPIPQEDDDMLHVFERGHGAPLPVAAGAKVALLCDSLPATVGGDLPGCTARILFGGPGGQGGAMVWDAPIKTKEEPGLGWLAFVPAGPPVPITAPAWATVLVVEVLGDRPNVPLTVVG